MSSYDALIEAGITRFRPVMLTAITTILGLIPMAIGLSIDFFAGKVMMGTQSGDWWGPMAVAVIFGLAFATLLTLVFVPVAYSLLESVRAFLARLARLVLRRSGPAEAGAE
jgi:multidrug efflux pump subunit AcrB